jgi:hypothetical protein
MKHVGILAHSTEGAALGFLTFCQEGFRRLGRNEHLGCDATSTWAVTRSPSCAPRSCFC